jgi:hypothetical protein
MTNNGNVRSDEAPLLCTNYCPLHAGVDISDLLSHVGDRVRESDPGAWVNAVADSGSIRIGVKDNKVDDSRPKLKYSRCSGFVCDRTAERTSFHPSPGW